MPSKHLKLNFDIAISSGHGDWQVNGEDVSEEISEHLKEGQWLDDVFDTHGCPDCGHGLIITPFEDSSEDNDEWHLDRFYNLYSCQHCGHWHFKGFEGGNKCMDPKDFVQITSVASRFAPTLPEGCSHELAQYIRRHPEHWHCMRPKDLELLVAAIYKANYRDAEVFHVGKPQDRGIDVVYIDANETRNLIQVKRREHPGRKEGFATFQSILGAMALTELGMASSFRRLTHFHTMRKRPGGMH